MDDKIILLLLMFLIVLLKKKSSKHKSKLKEIEIGAASLDPNGILLYRQTFILKKNTFL